MTSGQPKKEYQVDSEEQLFICLQQLEALGIRSCHIRDAGRTQVFISLIRLLLAPSLLE